MNLDFRQPSVISVGHLYWRDLCLHIHRGCLCHSLHARECRVFSAASLSKAQLSGGWLVDSGRFSNLISASRYRKRGDQIVKGKRQTIVLTRKDTSTCHQDHVPQSRTVTRDALGNGFLMPSEICRDEHTIGSIYVYRDDVD